MSKDAHFPTRELTPQQLSQRYIHALRRSRRLSRLHQIDTPRADLLQERFQNLVKASRQAVLRTYQSLVAVDPELAEETRQQFSQEFSVSE